MKPPITKYKKEELEKFFEDIAEEYGYSSANVAKFHAAHALIKQKEIKEKFKFYAIWLLIAGFAVGYFLFNINIITFFNNL
jgi:hypothetical protein